jgi:hypothetical protein
MPPRAHIVVALTMAAALALASHAAGAEDRGGRPSQASDRSGGVGSMRRAARPDAATLAIALAEANRPVADARGKLLQAQERYGGGAKAARQLAETRSLATDGDRRKSPEHDYRTTARVPGRTTPCHPRGDHDDPFAGNEPTGTATGSQSALIPEEATMHAPVAHELHACW